MLLNGRKGVVDNWYLWIGSKIIGIVCLILCVWFVWHGTQVLVC